MELKALSRRAATARLAALAGALGVAGATGVARAQTKPIRIAHIYSRTGPLEAYGKQTQTGLMLGLDYATQGTMKVAGRPLEVLERDDQGKPDVGKSLLAAAYGDDKVDLAIGPSSSGVALALLPVAEEYRKILLVEPAVADSITGEKWNRYIFRTGRNSSQDAIANAVALDRDGVSIATLAQDYAFGRDGVRAFKDALKKAHIVHEEYLPTTTTDFTAGAQRLFDALKGRPGRKVIFIIWAGGTGNPLKIADLDPKRYGIEIATGGNILPAMAAYKQFPGMEGATYYYYAIPKNPANNWLITEHYRRYKSPPDFFTAGGMAAAMAVVKALTLTRGDSSSKALMAAMEGMSFETPKGTMTFRKEDHQAMQSMYHFRIKVDPAVPWGVPELVREIRADEMAVPIRNAR
jgi:branched-chain amino acid transport system substrate-binding protein